MSPVQARHLDNSLSCNLEQASRFGRYLAQLAETCAIFAIFHLSPRLLSDNLARLSRSLAATFQLRISQVQAFQFRDLERFFP